MPDTPPIFTINDIVEAGRQAGVHPSLIRRKLQELGIHWGYEYPRHQGGRERRKRLRKAGLCEEGCGAYAPSTREPRMCDDCAAKAWSE